MPNVTNRISAEQILNDPWITGSSKAPPKSAKKPKLKKDLCKTISTIENGPIDDFSIMDGEEVKSPDELSKASLNIP